MDRRVCWWSFYLLSLNPFDELSDSVPTLLTQITDDFILMGFIRQVEISRNIIPHSRICRLVSRLRIRQVT